MPSNRYYIDTPLEKSLPIHLSGDEATHLIRVMRSRIGDKVELVNGKGQLAKAELISLDKSNAELSIIEVQHRNIPYPQIILAAAISRMNHLEWIVEKGTELNAAAFWLFPGLLSEKQALSETQLTRLRALMVASMKQCGRLYLPEILLYPPLLKWQKQEGRLFFGDTDKEAPYLMQIPITEQLPSPIIFFTGPESGFDPKERAFLLEKLQAQGVRLHENILRAETAPIVALSQLLRFVDGC